MVPYPADLPTDEIKDLINIIKSGNAVANRTKLAKDVWTLEGYALSKAFGETPATFAQSGPPPSDDQIIQSLESIVNQHENPHIMQALPPLPWATIAKWALQIVISLL